MIYSGKNVIVLGLGGSGEAAARLLSDEGAHVTVCDSGNSVDLQARAAGLESVGIHTKLGPLADQDSDQYDLCVLSPGIDPATAIVQNVKDKEIPIIGEIELAFEECSCPVIAITGTNGKTTTTELTATILSGVGLRTMACGNIGLPFSAAVMRSSELDFIVLEASSFQLETVVHFRAHVAAWLNFSPNHLDRYPDVDAYRAAKLRLFERQMPDDFAVVNADDFQPDTAAKKISFSSRSPDADFTFRDRTIFFQGSPLINLSDTRLTGRHNAENLMASLAISHALGVDLEKSAAASRDYMPPAHRCERVREINGVEWINDSKATTLDAMEKAIFAVERPLVLIAGGKNKGFGFEPMAKLVSARVRKAILIGEMRESIAAAWVDTDCDCVDSLEAAVSAAAACAMPGDAVLFSPGTSSFDMFTSYVDRGNQFKTHALSL